MGRQTPWRVWFRKKLGPALGTPKALVDRLHAETLRISQSAEIQDRIKGLGMQPSVMTPE